MKRLSVSALVQKPGPSVAGGQEASPPDKASPGIECGGTAWGLGVNDLSFASNRHKTIHTHLHVCDAENSQVHFPMVPQSPQ